MNRDLVELFCGSARPFRSLLFRSSLTICVMFLAGASPQECQSTSTAAEKTNAEQVDGDRLSPTDLAAWIDERFEDSWNQQGLHPAALTTDSEFIRRVFLDLIGRIPSVAEVRQFIEETRPNKRQVLVEELLQRGAFAAHLANTWRELLLPGDLPLEVRAQAPALETWLKLRFSANMPYDQLATELLTASIESTNPTGSRTPSPMAFYQAAEFKPEQLAASVSKVFLGVQVQCAQCHDHPFAAWKQPQFWSFAAFFQNIDRPRTPDMMQATGSNDTDEIQIPGKDILVRAAFLDGTRPPNSPLSLPSRSSKRADVAQWVTSTENPLFAKAVVNRVWANFFGRGFVHPVDDLDPANTPVFGDVFDELCVQFRLHRSDLKYLVRTITATRAYQRSSRGTNADESLTAQFARMPLRRLTSDQIYASLVQATGFREPVTNRGIGVPSATRDEFQSKFADATTSPTEIETTILQALSLMNGRFMAEATDVESSEFLSSVADAPFLDHHTRLETLFLATVGRVPEPEEIDLFHTTDTTLQKAMLTEAFWTLLNSAEFLLNH